MIGHPQGACGAAGLAATMLGIGKASFIRQLTSTIPILIAISTISPTQPAPIPAEIAALQLHRIWKQEQCTGRECAE